MVGVAVITATRRVQFAVGHRVHRHESKCRNLHGHNYVFFLTASAPDLDGLGRVVDFGVLKSILGGWIEKHWDHGFLLWSGDEEALRAVRSVQDQKLYELPYNPTAENMGRYLLEHVGPACLKGTGVTLSRVEVWETENCIAEVSL